MFSCLGIAFFTTTVSHTWYHILGITYQAFIRITYLVRMLWSFINPSLLHSISNLDTKPEIRYQIEILNSCFQEILKFAKLGIAFFKFYLVSSFQVLMLYTKLLNKAWFSWFGENAVVIKYSKLWFSRNQYFKFQECRSLIGNLAILVL